VTHALETIDYSALEQIMPGSTVVIDGVWYSKLFPWLAERQVHGIYIDDCEKLQFAREHNFASLLINRSGAIEDAVCYLNSFGCKRIATLKCGGFAPENPYRIGFLNGLKRCTLNYDPELIKLFPTSEIFPSINHQYFKTIISELWSATKFDAIILSVPDISTTLLTVLQHELGLKVPDDVAVISLHDRIEHVNSHLPITAIEFPWYDMGRECAKLLDSETVPGSSIKFNATLTERESTRKGAGSFVNSKILPECKLGARS
jgi:DNA-binding LacI/PurR family transcriptional regulator